MRPAGPARDVLRRAEPWLWVAVLAPIAVALLLGMTERALAMIDSDVLVPWEFTQHLLDHGFDVAFAFGGPTFVFPDYPLFFAARGVADGVGPTFSAYAAFQFVFLAAAVLVLLRACAARRDALDVPAALAVTATYMAAALADGGSEPCHWLFYPVGHQGSCTAGVLVLALAARIFEGDTRVATRVALGAVAAATTMSDFLVVTQVAVPLIVAGTVSGPRACGHVQAARVVTWTTGGAACGVAAYVALDATEFLQIVMMAAGPATAAPLRTAETFVRDVAGFAAGPAAFFALGAAAAIVLALRRAQREPLAGASRVMLATLAAVWIATLAVPPLSGRWDGPASLRYILPALLAPLVAAGVAVAACAPGRGPRRAFLAVCVVACGATAALRGSFERPATPYPDIVRSIDATAVRHGVREGMADYWIARLTNALTREGVRVRAIQRNSTPLAWLQNLDAFWNGAPGEPRWPESRFVVDFAIDLDACRRTHGAPATVVDLGRWGAGGPDHVGMWLRPPPGPPFDTAWMRDDLLVQAIATGLRPIDPRLVRRDRRRNAR